jgi:hypothetical protein
LECSANLDDELILARRKVVKIEDEFLFPNRLSITISDNTALELFGAELNLDVWADWRRQRKRRRKDK